MSSNLPVLRYPGGKSRAVNQILEYIPNKQELPIEEMVSPFLGGGSVELACAHKLGVKVYGSDSFDPLINFWEQAKKDPVELSKHVSIYHPLEKSTFYSLQRSYRTLQKPMFKAAVFFVLNRSSFSGLTFAGGMSPHHPRFTKSSIDRLKNFKADGVSVECLDYKDALKKHPDKFAYLDPPYCNGSKLYGYKGELQSDFDHEELAKVLSKRERWLLSYNDCAYIRYLYKDYYVETPRWCYDRSSNKPSKELFIHSLKLSEIDKAAKYV